MLPTRRIESWLPYQYFQRLFGNEWLETVMQKFQLLTLLKRK